MLTLNYQISNTLLAKLYTCMAIINAILPTVWLTFICENCFRKWVHFAISL